MSRARNVLFYARAARRARRRRRRRLGRARARRSCSPDRRRQLFAILLSCSAPELQEVFLSFLLIHRAEAIFFVTHIQQTTGMAWGAPVPTAHRWRGLYRSTRPPRKDAVFIQHRLRHGCLCTWRSKPIHKPMDCWPQLMRHTGRRACFCRSNNRRSTKRRSSWSSSHSPPECAIH